MTKKIPKTKSILLLSLSLVAVSFLAYYFLEDAQLETYDGPPRALIIDQLYDEMPNTRFHIKATEYLEKAGYTVDIVTTQNVTVDFYKELPKMNYKYVVVRTHGAENTNNVVLFTGEYYTEERYVQEQLFGQVEKAAPLREISYKVDTSDSSNWTIVNETTKIYKTSTKPVDVTKVEYFAIGPNFVDDGMKGSFDDTVFLLGGCNTLSNPSLANSLIDRGASTVIGWDDTVGNSSNDHAMLFFLEKTLVNNEPIDKVLSDHAKYVPKETMAYPATLISYT